VQLCAQADGAAVVGSEAALLATPAATSVKPVTSAKLASQPQVARPLLSLGGQTGAALKKLRSDIEAYVGKMPEGKAQQKRALLAITSATHAHVLSEQGLAAPAELPAAAAADLGGAWATLLEEWPPTQQFLLLFLARFLVGSAAFTNAWLAAGAARSLLDGCLKEQAGTPNPGRAARLMGLTTLANLAASEEAVAALLALAPAEASELIERSFSLLGGADADAALLAAALLHNLCLGFPNHAELSGPVLESQLLLISGLLPALSEQVSPAASQRLLVALGALLARGGDECVGTAQVEGCARGHFLSGGRALARWGLSAHVWARLGDDQAISTAQACDYAQGFGVLLHPRSSRPRPCPSFALSLSSRI